MASGPGSGFLNFNRFVQIQSEMQHTHGFSSPPRVIVSSDDPEFDPIILSHLKDEGFTAIYIPFDGNVKAYKNQLAHFPDSLELGESFAIIGMAGIT